MKVLLYPIATEKAINLIEKSNIITFMVDLRSKKQEIRKEFEDTFKVKVDHVNVEIEAKNRKRAYIRIGKQFKASDIALKLKLV